MTSRAVVFALLAATLASCLTTADVDSVAQVELTPANATVELGRTLPLTATARGESGAAANGQPFTWSSSNVGVATVSSAGLVTARGVGEARIAASAGGRSAVATVTVTAREVARVELAPTALSVRVGRTAALLARALDAEEQPLTGRVLSFASSAPTIATVSAQGVVTAIAPGAAVITATSEGRSAQAAVTVTPEPVASVTLAPALDTLVVGNTRTLGVTLRDVDGALLGNRPVSWSVNNVAVASVSSAGVVTALSPGTVTISAVSEGRVGQATVVVLARLADAITLTPSSATLSVGTTVTLLAQVAAPDGTLLPDRPVSFSSNAPTIASVSASGVVTAVAPGEARITATSEGKSAVAVITVTPEAVAQVMVTPPVSEALVGGARQLFAEARSASGSLIAGRSITWMSGAPSVATVNATGVVSGVSAGSVLVAATIDGVTGFATVTVRPVVVGSVLVLPEAFTLTVGNARTLELVVRDQSGSPLVGRPVVWTSSDETIAFVSSTGQVVALRAGTATISATVEGVRGSSLVTVP